MKLLIETKRGKKGYKTFKTLSETKEFIKANKDKMSKVALVEGPLGSDDSAIKHPIKAVKNYIKGNKKNDKMVGPGHSFKGMLFDKDYDGKDFFHYIKHEAEFVIIDYIDYQVYSSEVTVYYSKEKHMICIILPAARYKVSKESKEYEYTDPMNIPLVKLTKYIENNKKLPSNNQLDDYLAKVITARLESETKKRPVNNKWISDEDSTNW